MRSAHALYDCKMGAYLVAKCYFGKAASTSSTSKVSLQNDVKMQIVAKRLATEFSLSEKIEKGVDFIFTCWYEIKNPIEAGLDPSMSMFTAEPYIEGEYKKYNNNNGWIRDDGLNLSETAQAFSHFTWQKTFGQLMVVDLQGVGSILTDPQIHSTHENFGSGNLSETGMTAFFATHECNSVCRALALKPLKATEAETNGGAGSTTEDCTVTEKAADKLMACSCPLCGGITMVLHSKFIAAYIAVIGNLVNLAAGYGLAYHTSMGFNSIAVARALGNVTLALLLVPYFLWRPQQLRQWWSHGWDFTAALSYVGLFLHIGCPGMVMLAVEVWAFEVLSILAGVLPDSVVALATHAVLMNVNPKKAEMACYLALAITLGVSLVFTALLFGLSDYLPKLFLDDDESIALASKIMARWSPLEVADGLNAVMQ
ncbi:hypothetical protein PHYPSEUDO_006925 [Phytophthora pseudosyringae]|uniref:Alpha-type protein kinase domain-containing protein n=1 Tax=Phytophthora pseudosyringae TaxID=221518 RepID=A0A8T1VIA7_9STRA|nr:hypothetical protein PHYPSEUDO_006925 [Phytophthora pseudosyringae]